MKFLTSSAIFLALFVSLSAGASSIEISFQDQSVSANTYAQQLEFANDTGDSVIVSGLQATLNGSIKSISVGNSYSNSNFYYGLQTQPLLHGEHGITNRNNNFRMVLLDFGKNVQLDSFGVGWTQYGDSNPDYASVLAYQGNDDLSILNSSWSDLYEKGFITASSNTDQGAMSISPYSKINLTQSVVARYWLLGAVNWGVGHQIDGWIDGFKLTGVTYTYEVSEVPLPAAAWLFLTGLAGMTWMKKRKQKRDQLQAA